MYPKGRETLAQAEITMLKTYVIRAELKNGMSILDLGYDSIKISNGFNIDSTNQ